MTETYKVCGDIIGLQCDTTMTLTAGDGGNEAEDTFEIDLTEGYCDEHQGIAQCDTTVDKDGIIRKLTIHFNGTYEMSAFACAIIKLADAIRPTYGHTLKEDIWNTAKEPAKPIVTSDTVSADHHLEVLQKFSDLACKHDLLLKENIETLKREKLYLEFINDLNVRIMELARKM